MKDGWNGVDEAREDEGEKAGQSQNNVSRGTSVLYIISISTEREGRPVPAQRAQRDNGPKCY